MVEISVVMLRDGRAHPEAWGGQAAEAGTPPKVLPMAATGDAGAQQHGEADFGQAVHHDVLHLLLRL